MPAALPKGTFRVLLFSVLRQRTGRPHVDVELALPATGADLLDRLVDEYPVIGSYRSSIRLAVNHAYQPETVVLRAGDEVAAITPVSGG